MKTAQTKKIGILGVGNILLSDEGFGIHLLRYLEEHFHFPPEVELMDGGTAGIYMAPFLEECNPVLIIDIIARDDTPGTIHTFNKTDIKANSMGLRLSPHQLGLLEMVDICELRGAAPEKLFFFTIVPQSLATGLDLSPCLKQQLKPMAQKIINQLGQLGCQIKQR